MRRLDANETIFFQNELDKTKAKAYLKKFPKLKATTLFPVSAEADEGDETITYEMFTEVGIAKIIANYADDLPTADVKGERFTSDIRSIGVAYHYNVQEIRAANKTNKPLKQKKANAAKRANDTKVNKIAWFGDSEYNLFGFLNNPNIPVDIQTNKIDNTSTPDEILDILNNSVIDTHELTNGEEIPDTMVMPIKQYGYIQRTPRSATNDTTILTFFLTNNPSIKTVEWDINLKDVTPAPSGAAGPVDCLITFEKDADRISLEIPMAWEQMDPERKNLSYKIDTESRCGGILTPYPLSCRIMEDI